MDARCLCWLLVLRCLCVCLLPAMPAMLLLLHFCQPQFLRLSCARCLRPSPPSFYILLFFVWPRFVCFAFCNLLHFLVSCFLFGRVTCSVGFLAIPGDFSTTGGSAAGSKFEGWKWIGRGSIGKGNFL